jgi:hypothetical protein
MIDISAAGSDEQRNVQLLKESPWLDIAIAYINGNRAILATPPDLDAGLGVERETRVRRVTAPSPKPSRSGRKSKRRKRRGVS